MGSSECYPWIQGLQARKLCMVRTAKEDDLNSKVSRKKNHFHSKPVLNENQKYQYTLRTLDVSRNPEKYPD